MDRKEFRRRLVNYYIHPELFLIPIKKKEEPVYEITIYCKTWGWQIVDQVKSKYNSPDALGLFIIINKQDGRKYRTRTIARSVKISIPQGQYKIKCIAVGNNGSHVNNKWYDFEITSNGRVQIPQSINFEILSSYNSLTIYQPSSVWKVHSYLKESENIPVHSPTPYSGVARPSGLFGPENKTPAKLSEIKATIDSNFWGMIKGDIWFNDDQICQDIPISTTYWDDMNSGGTNDVFDIYFKLYSSGRLNFNITGFFAKANPRYGYINYDIKSFVYPNDKGSETDFSSTYNLRADLGDLYNKSAWIDGDFRNTIWLAALGKDAGKLKGETELNYYDSCRQQDINLETNTFNSNFSEDQFAEGQTTFASYYPKKSQVENLAKPGSYAWHYVRDDMFSSTLWKYMKSKNEYSSVWINTFCSISNYVMSNLITGDDYFPSKISTGYFRTHTVIAARKLPKHEVYETYSIDGQSTEILLHKLDGGINLFKADRATLYGEYNTVDEYVKATFGDDCYVVQEDYSNTASEILYQNDKMLQTEYGKSLYNASARLSKYSIGSANASRTAIFGTPVYLGDNVNDVTYFVGAYSYVSFVDDYESYMDDPDVKII